MIGGLLFVPVAYVLMARKLELPLSGHRPLKESTFLDGHRLPRTL